MYEKRAGFVQRFGIFFQDTIGRAPTQAMKRMRPMTVIAVMVSFLHKCALAFVFGNWSRYRKSWTQIVLLVCSSLYRISVKINVVMLCQGIHVFNTLDLN